MAVDFYEASSSATNNNPFFNGDCFQRQDSSDWSSITPNLSNQRPHLRLYERQQTNGGQQTAVTTPQSPLNGDSFGCWSPISQNDEDQVKWSNGYDTAAWMKNSSSENSTTSSTEDYDSDPSSQFFQPSYYSNQNQQVNSNPQWSSNQQNDENILSQMLRLNLDFNNKDQQQYSPSTATQMTRKWSHEDQTTKPSAIAQHNFYAPYIQQQHSISNIHQQRLPSVDDCQFIPATNAKWSTAQDSFAMNNNRVNKSSHQAFTHQTSLPNAHELRAQNKGRQIFAQLNAYTMNPGRRPAPAISCDEAEIQWYHHHLELQQSVYDQIYSKVLSGELKKKQALKAQSAQQPESQPPIERQSNPTTLPSSVSSPVTADLMARLEQCTAQYRQLEKERKKTEAELAKHHLGKKISSSNNLQIPRLPTAPSRIDRLIVDFFREHARVVTLLGRMEQLRGVQFEENLHKVMLEWLDAIRLLQQRRLSERNAILSHLSGELGFYDEEKELNDQKEALILLAKAAIRARSANWCALILTLGADSSMQQMQLERIQSLDYRCEPPEIQARPLKTQS